MKGIADVDAGICGFNAHIEAEARDAFGPCTVSLETECKNLQKLEKQFGIDIMDTLKNGYRSIFFKRVMELTPPIHFRSTEGFRRDCAAQGYHYKDKKGLISFRWSWHLLKSIALHI
jgi:hypothetical protein